MRKSREAVLINRRSAGAIAAGAIAAGAGTLGRSSFAARDDSTSDGPRYCAFIKFLQSLSHKQLAKAMRAQGFHGIEATVRPKGQVEPERVTDDLPPLVEALSAEQLEISIMASDVNRADDRVSERVLRTAAKLGVKCYRMKYYRYESAKPLKTQLENLKPMVRDLAALNKELGLRAVYQNHSGAANVGAPVWDLAHLLEDVSPDQVGVAFDIRHATVEGGMSWPLNFRVIRPHLGAIYFKDFVWNKQRRRPQNVPLGEGLVDSAFCRTLRKIDYQGLISVHVEYLGDQGVEANLKAMQTDFNTLKRWMMT